MERGTIERDLYVDASPEVVFDVVSDPEHVRRWWPDEADYPVEVGGSGRIGFRDAAQQISWVRFTVVEVQPHHRFSFRWTHDEGETAGRGNSFLVEFELTPEGSGTRLRMTESGYRERGWSEAEVAAAYADHVEGWSHFLPRLPEYAEQLGARA